MYKTDSIKDTTTITVDIIQREVIGGVKVYTQDIEFKVDDLALYIVMHTNFGGNKCTLYFWLAYLAYGDLAIHVWRFSCGLF